MFTNPEVPVGPVNDGFCVGRAHMLQNCLQFCLAHPLNESLVHDSGGNLSQSGFASSQGKKSSQ